ncbi:MAG: hypothetical protein Q9187_007691 [Circinaria calcarea]
MNCTGGSPADGNPSNVQGPEIHNDRSSVKSSEHSSHQTLITVDSLMDHSEHYPLARAAAAITIPASTTPFTTHNLDQHNQQQEREFGSIIDLDEEQRRFDEQVQNLRLTLQSLGVDEVPDHFLIGMALNYDGMVSMERLWAEYEDSLSMGAMREGYHAQNEGKGDLDGFEGYELYGEEEYLGSSNAYPA